MGFRHLVKTEANWGVLLLFLDLIISGVMKGAGAGIA